MDWHLNLLLLLALMPFVAVVQCWTAIPSSRSVSNGRQINEVSPYLDLALCPLRQQPWSCARQQSARLLDVWDDELHSQWQKLKVEADRQLNSTLEKRGYSSTMTMSKEKPSTILKKIEIGTNFMKEYLAETMDGFLGREYEYMLNTKNNDASQNDDNEEENNDEEEEDDDEAVDDDEEQDDNEAEDEANEVTQTGGLKNTFSNNANANDAEDEFIEIPENTDENEELKKPGGGSKRKKNKRKGNQHDGIPAQAANLLIVQPLEHQLTQHQHDDGDFGVAQHISRPIRKKVKPLKQKRRKRKRKGQQLDDGGISTVVVEQEPSSDHLALGLLEELSNLDDAGGKRKKRPMKYGRSNGVTRGKKKKKKKALMKLMLLGQFLKAKIELLLKLLGAHLQIKFFAIALIGLLINIARFWIDVKRGGVPQKVVYVEHAHHQHHYEDHGDDWSESAGGSGGSYWKRSLQTDSTEDTYDTATDSYQPRPIQQQHQQYQPQQEQYQQNYQQQHQQYGPQYMAYRNQWQQK